MIITLITGLFEDTNSHTISIRQTCKETLFMQASSLKLSKILFPVTILSLFILAYFFPFIHQMRAGLAIFLGISLSLLFENPYQTYTKQWVSRLLTWSVVGLGFGMNLITVAKVGAQGIGYTLFSIVFCIILGLLLGRTLKNPRDTSVLITCGTAICGGSAIAAIAPAIRAQGHDISLALATIFLLNAIALFIFPPLGHYFNLSQAQFGLWAALAIHDTSSVVGATMQYGQEALEVGTTVKLARALWIVPLTFIVSFVYARYVWHKNDTLTQKPKRPWFILGFLLAAALVTWVPWFTQPGQIIRQIAEQGLVLTLFLIGANVSRTTLKEVGIAPFMQGGLLWLVMGVVTLGIVQYAC